MKITTCTPFALYEAEDNCLIVNWLHTIHVTEMAKLCFAGNG